MDAEGILRARAREMIREGKLPRGRAAQLWGGHGSGDDTCCLCALSIDVDHLEYELQFCDPQDADRRSIHFHLPCLRAWEAELEALGVDLSMSGRPGTLSGRECGEPERGAG